MKIATRFVRRSVPAAVIAVAALVVLSACAPRVPIHHTVTPHHPSTPSTPSVTPTAAALAPPKVRIPLSCSQIGPSAQVNTALGATLTSSNEFPDPDLTDYNAIQDGALNCAWAGPVTSGYSNANYSILVIPDATPTWNEYSSQIGEETYPTNDFGPDAYGSCFAESDPSNSIGCTLDVLVGSDWLDISGDNSNLPSLPSLATVQANFMPLLKTAYNAVKGATTIEPAWSDPAATATNLPPDQGAVVSGAFDTAIGREFASEVSQPTWDQGGAIIAEFLPTGFRSDAGGGTGAGETVTPATDYDMSIDVLPSGSWAYAQMKSAASGQPGFTVIAGLGTKAFAYTAPMAGGDPDHTSLVGVVGQHLYSISIGTPGTAGTPDTLALAKTAAAYVVTELG